MDADFSPFMRASGPEKRRKIIPLADFQPARDAKIFNLL
jgi:hypothetical protein